MDMMPQKPVVVNQQLHKLFVTRMLLVFELGVSQLTV